MTATFDDLRSGRRGRPRGICPACGTEKVAGMIRIEIRQLGSTDRKKHVMIASKSQSLCEPCAVKAYTATIEALS